MVKDMAINFQKKNKVIHSICFGKTQDGMGVEGKSPDWKVVLIADAFKDEIDCYSGQRRRVFNTGKIKYLEN